MRVFTASSSPFSSTAWIVPGRAVLGLGLRALGVKLEGQQGLEPETGQGAPISHAERRCNRTAKRPVAVGGSDQSHPRAQWVTQTRH